MAEIVMTGDAYDKIFKVCAPIAAKKKDSRPSLTQIELRVTDGECIATALDGYVMAQCRVKCKGDNGSYLIPVVKIDTKAARNAYRDITISWADGFVSIYNGDVRYTQKECSFPYVNWDGVLDKASDEAQYKIFVSAALLKKIAAALSDVDNSTVRLDFRGRLDGIQIVGSGVRGLLLPVDVNGALHDMFSFEGGHSGGQAGR